MAEKIKGKKNLIIILAILLVGFLLIGLGDKKDKADVEVDNKIATSSVLLVDEIVPVGLEENEDSISDTTSLKDELISSDLLTGTGGPVIIGYDEEKFPIYSNDDNIIGREDTLSADLTYSEPNTIAYTGTMLITSLDTVSDETYELIKPDLLELIAALEKLIVQFEAYIEFRKSQVGL